MRLEVLQHADDEHGVKFTIGIGHVEQVTGGEKHRDAAVGEVGGDIRNGDGAVLFQAVDLFIQAVQVREGQPGTKADLQHFVPTAAFRQAHFHPFTVQVAEAGHKIKFQRVVNINGGVFLGREDIQVDLISFQK